MTSIFTQILVALSALLLLYKLWSKKHRQNSNSLKSAPEPAGAWPLIGHFHLLVGQVPVYRILGGLADENGLVFGLRLGLNKTLVVSSWEAVKDCFTTNDKILAKRPTSVAGIYLGYDYASFGFADGPYWREVRKLALQELLSPRRLETLKHVRESEIHSGIKELYKTLNKLHISHVSIPSCNFPNRSIQERCGYRRVVRSDNFEHDYNDDCWKRYTNGTQGVESTVEVRSVREHIKEFMYVLGQFIVADAFPFPPFSWIDYQGHIKSMKRITKGLSTIFERFTRFGHTRETIIKATVSNLIIAGNDTTSLHMTWLLCLLLNNKRVLQRAQEELDTNVGRERWVQESDIKNLVYLQAIIKEALRLYPPGPLAVPHEAMEDCCVGGYHVPKGTRVMFNLWKLHRDPKNVGGT
ncbi:Xanthotoxin 5-hydroxylase CYP82C4 [Sesamum angolense]|uniref:Xanthotoxin 5-hydroxylase CYP82C4 n=1 Tax=Sesamum angolense TaxID=2727404 RepID=A0AAE1XC71_9LAMI|nr:Xanthotoxin 5-hydroxylase CYP82C4 [Sesamum angolense]